MKVKLQAELTRLYHMGFALHFLLPKSKRPANSKWTSGPRMNLDQLLEAHQSGYNIGCRLGEVSQVGPGFLAVIDCDVKSELPHHQAEMGKALAQIFPDLPLGTPRVVTGRGNGSCHIYVASPLPATPRRLAQSSEKVRVKMGSVPPSKFEEGTMSPADLKAGWRLRYAWEISVMGEGQQVVMPPSIHPDSGRQYLWGFPIVGADDVPLLDLPGEVKVKRERPDLARNGDFKPCPVDLIGSSLPDSIVDMILTGEGCTDRSAGLFKAAMAMCREKFTDDEIMTVLTDPDTVLGQAAFDHVQTKSRGKAAAWIYQYTVKKARAETNAAADFADDVVVVEAVLGDAEAAAQKAELVSSDWRDAIERDKTGKPKGTLLNVLTIWRGEFGGALFIKNEFSGYQLYGRDVPWGGVLGQEITDEQLSEMKAWFAKHYRFEPGNDKLIDAINVVAAENAFHPVRDYLDTLEWDGVSRIDTWLRDYLGATAREPYLSCVSRKVLCAMVARIYKPGCKFDYVLILEGKQGIGKSTAVRHLTGDAWFTDAHINIADKDGVLAMKAAWVVELGELSGMRKADVDLLKEFISRTSDRIRVPYGRRTENFPRQCIFIGTTNSAEYLRDTTGNRRFWPVKVGVYDFEAIKLVRDQLLAEAKFAWEMGEALYLDEKGATDAAIEEQEDRTEDDTWNEHARVFFEAEKNKPENERAFNIDAFTMRDAFCDFGPFAGHRDDRGNHMRAASALRKNGFNKIRRRLRTGNPTHVWCRADANGINFDNL